MVIAFFKWFMVEVCPFVGTCLQILKVGQDDLASTTHFIINISVLNYL